MDGLIAYALSKKYVDQKTGSIATGMSWKGAKENVNDLPQVGNLVGDLWHVNENGNEYAWDGNKWEALGGLDKSFTETDPTVPDWAKQPQKPAYTAAEVGALPSSTFIPSKVSDLQNDSGYLTSVPVQSVNDKTGAVVLNASDVGALPADTPIPDAVTEQTVSEWGFTKNTGDYTKPSGGIPKNDLESVVQASLDKADTALQQHQSLTGYATETWIEAKGYQTASDVQTAIAGKVNAADVYTKTEVDQKLVGAMDYKGTKATVSELPTSGNATGDVWHITADGSEWAWNGSAWEELGTAVDLSGYRTASAQDTIDNAQNVEIAKKANIADLAAVATSGSYNDLTDKPTIPSLTGYATQAWVNNKGYLTLADLPVYNGGVA